MFCEEWRVGLKSLNLQNEVLFQLASEEDLMEVLSTINGTEVLNQNIDSDESLPSSPTSQHNINHNSVITSHDKFPLNSSILIQCVVQIQYAVSTQLFHL